jgi:hypothetical protein
MYFKVKITKGLPQAKTGGFTGNNLNKQVISFGGADMNAASRHLESNKYLKEVPEEEANLEAENGESAFGDVNGDGFTEHMKIGGKRHSQGGTKLNLPDGTFIFSDTAAMKIKDPEILTKFGKKSGSYTPAELAKPYDINKYRTILEDPNSDKVDKKTAELMIKNINLKLGALALAQESKKGFPQGIPEVAQPYMQQMGIKEEDLIPQKAQPEAQIDQQAMNNPYENQGMGMQSPEEESMEQVQGMQNPQEESMEMPPMAQYGMMMGDNNYTRNFAGNQQYREGGSLTRYQSKGEVKSKIYSKDKLPEGAITRDRITTDTKAGDYIKQEDGSYKKVTAATLSKTPTADTKSLGISVEEYKKQSPENAKLIEDANAIIAKGINDKTITSDKKGNIKITGGWKGDFKERILLSRALNATNTKGVFGTDKYKIVSQGATGPYSKTDPKNKKSIKGTGSFVAGFTPDLYEQRFIFEQAKGLGMSDDDAFGEVDRIQKDPKLKAQARRQFAGTLGIKDVPEDDKSLLSDDFYKKNYSDVTKGIESLVGEGEYRPAIGNEQLSGFEHFDAIGAKPEFQYEEDMPVTEEDAKEAEEAVAEEPIEAPVEQNPEWWLQDKVNMGLAASDYFDVQKALPWAARYEPELMTPTFYDPTRELAAQSEQANITNQALAQFTGPQALSARSASIQGQGAKQAADTLGRYNAQNVGVANQFEGNNAQVMNEAQRFNQAQNKQLYDQNVIANQQYKNTKRALKHNLGEAFNTGTTNMMKTDAMNQMYPEYAVDPSTGGRMHYVDNKRKIKPTQEMSLDEYAMHLQNSKLDPESKAILLKNRIKTYNSGSSDAVDPDMISKMYTKKGGSVQMGYVMGSNVFPFMFT